MAMTVTQAEQLINAAPATGNNNPDATPTPAPGDPNFGGGGGTPIIKIINGVPYLFDPTSGSLTPIPVDQGGGQPSLPSGNYTLINDHQAIDENGNIIDLPTDTGNGSLPPNQPTSRYSYIAPTKYHGWAKYDKQTGQYVPLSPEEEAFLSGGDGSGGAGGGGGTYSTSQAYLDQQLALQAARDAEAKREYDMTYGLNQQGQNQGFVQNRATTGISLGNLVNTLAENSYNRAADPGNFPGYLASIAGLPQGSNSPVSSLLGQGVQIQSPEGANPLADPRFQNLLSQEYDYAQPQSLQTVQSIAAQNNGQLPQSFYDYTGTQNPQSHAAGGSQTIAGMITAYDQAGRPVFTAGEAGPEQISFHPVHNHQGEGMSVPHAHAQGDVQHEHTGPNAQPSFKHYALGGQTTVGTQGLLDGMPTEMGAGTANTPTSPVSSAAQTAQTYTPAQGTDIALGKALKTTGFGQQGLLDQLMSGNGPTPGSVDEQTWARIPPSLRALLQAGIKSQLGRSGLMDWLAELENYNLPGNSSYTNTTYS